MLKTIITWGLPWPTRGVSPRLSATIPLRSGSDPVMLMPTITWAFPWPSKAGSPKLGSIFLKYCGSTLTMRQHAGSSTTWQTNDRSYRSSTASCTSLLCSLPDAFPGIGADSLPGRKYLEHGVLPQSRAARCVHWHGPGLCVSSGCGGKPLTDAPAIGSLPAGAPGHFSVCQTSRRPRVFRLVREHRRRSVFHVRSGDIQGLGLCDFLRPFLERHSHLRFDCAAHRQILPGFSSAACLQPGYRRLLHGYPGFHALQLVATARLELVRGPDTPCSLWSCG